MNAGLGISPSAARKAISGKQWDVANQVLYAFCKQHPNHDDEAVNIAKVWLIGRAYAAAIERGSKSEHQGDDLYTKRVGPTLKEYGMDEVLMPVRKLRQPDAKNSMQGSRGNRRSISQDIEVKPSLASVQVSTFSLSGSRVYLRQSSRPGDRAFNQVGPYPQGIRKGKRWVSEILCAL
jgi:hypothetical protein